MMLFPLIVLSLFVSSCYSCANRKNKHSTVNTNTPINPNSSYETKYQAIIQKSCGNCHGEQFATIELVNERAKDMINSIQFYNMPRNIGSDAFLKTEDGKALMTWLQAGKLD